MNSSRDKNPSFRNIPAPLSPLSITYGKNSETYTSTQRGGRTDNPYSEVSVSMPNLKTFLPAQSSQRLESNPFRLTSKMASPGQPSDLPKSVRNAPKELRAAIRRRQNNESARRNREKRREEQEQMERQYLENQQRIKELEKKVEEISSELISVNAGSSKKSTSSSTKKKSSSSNTRQRDAQNQTEKGFYGVPF